MTDEQYILTCLAEEASEVIHAASKCLRFGLETTWPETRETNGEMLAIELVELKTVVAELMKIAGERFRVPKGEDEALIVEEKLKRLRSTRVRADDAPDDSIERRLAALEARVASGGQVSAPAKRTRQRREH